MIIRTAEEDDLDNIVDLWKEFMDFHSALDSGFTLSKNGTKEFYRITKEKLSNRNWKIIVAEHENSLIGYCIADVEFLPPVFESREYGFIQDIFVSSLYRNKGVGKNLFNEVSKWFMQKHIRRVELNVLAINRSTIKFWESLGFSLFKSRMKKQIL